MRNADTAELRRLLLRRDDLAMSGWRRADIDSGVVDGRLIRLRRGRYMLGEHWSGLWPESRHRARVLSVYDDATGEPPVFALISAAALLGLPVHRAAADRIHCLVPGGSRRSTAGVVRHAGRLPDDDIVEIDGMLCTSPERTIHDLARLARAETAIACADAVLARIGGDARNYDAAAADAWIERGRERVAAAPTMRGIQQARSLLDIMDGRSQLPLESVTKLQLHRLGFRRLDLQVSVGGRYWMDIEMRGVDVFYECDGEAKYTDDSLRSGRTLERVLLDEKKREDWVRGVTGHRVLRGGSIHSSTPLALADRLSTFGVTLPPRRDRLIMPSRTLVAGL